MKKWRRIALVLALLIATFAGYVEIVNLNSTNMTYRQKVLKAIYPFWMWLTKLSGKNTSDLSHKEMNPPVSFYSLKATANNGSELDFSSFKGKKVLLVNTASNCGYTNQYEGLQQLYEENKERLIVIGFPANDFKEQEKGTDEEIAQFCQLNFGVNFPLVKKSTVSAAAGQHPVFKWLTDPAKNGWCSQAPEWNFSKYLINEEGRLVHYFGPSISPESNAIKQALQ